MARRIGISRDDGRVEAIFRSTRWVKNKPKPLPVICATRFVTYERLICSPLSRAKTTAQILGATLSLDIEVDDRLTELDLGEWEGKFEADLRAENSDFYDQWHSGGFLLPPPGGESLKDVADRLKPLVADIQAFPGDVLIVGHQASNMAFKAVLTGCFSAACLDGFRQDNDEIDIWELSPARFVRKIKATVDP